MSKPPSTPDPEADPLSEEDPEGTPSPSPAAGKSYSEDQYRRALNRKLANYVPKNEFDAALNRAAALEGQLTDLTTENQRLKTENGTLQLGPLRTKIGKELGIPSDWVDELKGSDEKSIKEHGEALKKKLGIKTPGLGVPVPTGQPGTPENENADMNAFLVGMAHGKPIGGR
jgi:hypothetical protein